VDAKNKLQALREESARSVNLEEAPIAKVSQTPPPPPPSPPSVSAPAIDDATVSERFDAEEGRSSNGRKRQSLRSGSTMSDAGEDGRAV
jgi:hypothetical protein